MVNMSIKATTKGINSTPCISLTFQKGPQSATVETKMTQFDKIVPFPRESIFKLSLRAFCCLVFCLTFLPILTIHMSRVEYLEPLSTQFGDRAHCHVQPWDTSINHNWYQQQLFTFENTKSHYSGHFPYWHSTLGPEIMSSYLHTWRGVMDHNCFRNDDSIYFYPRTLAHRMQSKVHGYFDRCVTVQCNAVM